MNSFFVHLSARLNEFPVYADDSKEDEEAHRGKWYFKKGGTGIVSFSPFPFRLLNILFAIVNSLGGRGLWGRGTGYRLAIRTRGENAHTYNEYRSGTALSLNTWSLVVKSAI